jgi:two-component system CheB/CheR fusion protein
MTSSPADKFTKGPSQSSPDRKSSTVSDNPAKTFSVVAIGASAGGLEACRALVDALPPSPGIAFILVLHLDPTHESMMVELLSGHTSLKVLQASEGIVVEPDHIYVIPPGANLSVEGRRLHLSKPPERHGARLPFDFLLKSVAAEFRERAICVILSGMGADGSAGLKFIREQGGLIISQDPDEAVYDGMPRSAVMTGAVDLVFPVAKIPAALVKYDRGISLSHAVVDSGNPVAAEDCLTKIVNLLREKTSRDFAPYKQGTLRRRIERRMAIAAIAPNDMGEYFDLLRRDRGELDLLASDLLINVTSFFRDPKVFDLVGDKFLPDLLKSHLPERPLRAWIAGCSTGEEAYSLAIIFRETMAALKLNLKLQIFASDVDTDAITFAREGMYPQAIEADVAPERLARFFIREDLGYRVSPDLRSLVVFTVQNVLADPPFARLDLISCRNLLIYLLPEAQAKVISLFHFALREGGILLLGNSETAGDTEGRFEVMSKPDRLYRHLGGSRPREFRFPPSSLDESRTASKRALHGSGARQLPLAELCRRIVLECYAPAAILINHSYECLYSLGPTDRYLSVPRGHATHDFISMAPKSIRGRLRAAIQRTIQENAKTIRDEISLGRRGQTRSLKIEIHPVRVESQSLLLVCFVDGPPREPESTLNSPARDLTGFSELEQELESTRVELHNAVHELESSTEEQKTIDEETSSVNEEFQATNEELLASKEELQSLNEELTALNGQLQETLERQRTTGNDLQNVLNSTDVATLFLDAQLNIRLFTPATRLLFSIIPSDVGRPLADLNSLAADNSLSSDAATVLRTLAPVEREIEARSGAWYIRRILPYRVPDGGVGGVVITFVDVTERRRVSEALEDARRQSQLANVAKSKFLAAASHDLRQPLQTLSLLQGLLARAVSGEREKTLVGRIDETILAMSGMLNALLDINQIEAGTVRPEIVEFSINDILFRMRDEFQYSATAKGLALRVTPCGLAVRSDPRLLEQMIRNLIANAVKYTTHGKILIGCRRKARTLVIHVKDTGIGIPKAELQAIFDEYHQIGNPARERSRGLGLGLSIVQRVADLLDHRISVHSILGKGSTFTIEVPRSHETKLVAPIAAANQGARSALDPPRRSGVVLIVEDDPDIREPLEMLLLEDGHVVETAFDGMNALSLVARGAIKPDLVLADYNLPNGLNGLELIASLRERLRFAIPAIILTGDISTGTLRDIAAAECVQLNKPINVNELTQSVQKLLPDTVNADDESIGNKAGYSASPQVIFVVDDDENVREMLRAVLVDDDRIVEDFASCEEFLVAYRPGRRACLLLDAYLPGMKGLDLLHRLAADGNQMPVVLMTGNSDISVAVEAMKAGAVDFIEKPMNRSDLLLTVERALEQAADSTKRSAWRDSSLELLASLTSRQRQIMDLVLAGHPSKNIAADLNISQRTVENHRAAIMAKTGSKSLPALARLAIAAG